MLQLAIKHFLGAGAGDQPRCGCKYGVEGHSTTFKKRKQEHKETQLIRVIQHTPVQS